MIKIKCDICGKEDLNINTLILYKRKIDYCSDIRCTDKIDKIKKELEKEVKLQNIYFKSALKEKEKQLMKEVYR